MNIKEFAERMKSSISNVLQKEVTMIEQLKINGIYSYGIRISEPNSHIGITISLEPFFEAFLDTDNWTRTVDYVLDFYKKQALPESLDAEWFHDFHQVRSGLYYILVNYEANEELLHKVPHTKFLDLAKIYYVQCSLGESNTGNILVRNEHLKDWGISIYELDKAAEENTPRLYPASITCLTDEAGLGNLLDVPFELPQEPLIPMFALSNTQSDHGATAVCYQKILEDFSQKVQDDLILLPSSLHEMILIPLHKNDDIPSHKEAVYDTNRYILEPSQFLSDNVYLFRRQDKQIAIA